MQDKYHIYCLIFLFCCFLPLGLCAQQASYFPNVQYITSDNGLSQSEVTCIIQDRQGFLWIGTRGGLNRYDGANFKIFQNEIGNTNSLINNSIESLFEDSKGRIWIGTKSNGVSCYDPEYDQFEHFQYHPQDTNTISGNRVISITESSTGEIWIGTWGNGLSIINFENKHCRRALGKTRISSLVPAKDGTIWATTNQRLVTLSQQAQILNAYQYPLANGGSAGFLNIEIVSQTGKLLLGTWSLGLFEFDPATATFTQFTHQPEDPTSISSNNVYRTFEDQQGRIWVGSWGGGLNLFHPETQTFTRYSLAGDRSKGGQELYNDILCIFQNQAGILWVGTNGGGICKVDESAYQFGLLGGSQNTSGLPNEPIWAVLKDQEDILWVGTKGGKAIYYSQDGYNFTSLELPKRLEQQVNGMKTGARAIFERRDGSLWLATKHDVFEINKENRSYEVKSHQFRGARSKLRERLPLVPTFYQTSDGSFWIGTQQHGLRKAKGTKPFDSQVFKEYLADEKFGSLKSDRISALEEDQNGRFWVGTYGGLHLYQAANDNFLHFSKKQGDLQTLSSDIIICLHSDRQGRLWVGTPNGLNLAIPGTNNSWTFQCLQEKDGLANNYIHGILEDKQGNLWISTNKGISKYTPEENVFYNYDINDGLQSNSFMEGAAFQDKYGQFYFGGIHGLNFFHPDSIRNNRTQANVKLTGLKIFNQEVKAGQSFNDRIILDRSIEYAQKITLSHKENVFSLDYTSLELRAPYKTSFRYKMEGLEEHWNTVGNQRSVTYSHLNPGTYIFKVDAGFNNEAWLENGDSLLIEVLPPFWATWQAFLCYALIFSGLLLWYRRIISQQNDLKSKLELARMAREKEIELAEMKTRFFTNITHELRTPLTLIAGPVEELMDEEKLTSKAKSYLMVIRKHTQRLAGFVNQLLDFRKAESGHMNIQAAEGNFVKFTHEVFLSFQALAKQNNVNFSFESKLAELPLSFDRDKMEIVLCNLLSNAFKYSPSNSSICLSIERIEIGDKTFPNGYCQISISDTGKGMPPILVEKIFDRFYQIANADSVKLVGTGIGLSLVKNIIDLHKGEIKVQSQEGLGSTFTLQLHLGRDHFTKEQLITGFRDSEHPSHYQANQTTSSLVPKSNNSKPENTSGELPHLLIVEDNQDIRTFIRNIFEGSFQVSEAENGQIGLELAQTVIPDLIISDVMMPKLDGITLCQNIKSDEKTAHIPLILLTARTSNVFQIEGYHSGADAYVSKPFQPAVLKAQVNGLLVARQQLKQYFSKKIRLQPTDVEITSADEQFLNKIMDLVEANLNNGDLSRDFLAQATAMSPSTLYRKIKALTGYTTNAFIRSIRLKRAAQLMRDSKFNISEIAYQVGFSDLKYFRTCFREQFETNPSEYIQNQLVATEKSES